MARPKCPVCRNRLPNHVIAAAESRGAEPIYDRPGCRDVAAKRRSRGGDPHHPKMELEPIPDVRIPKVQPRCKECGGRIRLSQILTALSRGREAEFDRKTCRDTWNTRNTRARARKAGR